MVYKSGTIDHKLQINLILSTLSFQDFGDPLKFEKLNEFLLSIENKEAFWKSACEKFISVDPLLGQYWPLYENYLGHRMIRCGHSCSTKL